MKSSLYKYLGFIFAAIGLISAIASTLTIKESWILYTALACAVITIVGSAFFFFKSQEFMPGGEETPFREPDFSPSDCEVRNAKNEAEVREIWRIDQSIYNETNISFKKLLSWWKSYPKGGYVLYQGSTIIGYLGLWPLKKKAFEDMLSGGRSESSITARSICNAKWTKGRSYWYVADIVIRKKYRRTDALRLLIHTAVESWKSEADFTSGVKICALGYSKEGRALLRRHGFSKYKDSEETLARLPIYLSTPQLSDLKQMFERGIDKSK